MSVPAEVHVCASRRHVCASRRHMCASRDMWHEVASYNYYIESMCGVLTKD